MKLETLKTPGLVLDVAKVKRNAERMSRRIKELGADLRPHIKTHKCIEVARIQTAGHSGAVTVSTLTEARAFAANGFTKITYAVPVEPGKFAEAIAISRDSFAAKVVFPASASGLNENSPALQRWVDVEF